MTDRPKFETVEHEMRDRVFRWLFETSDLLPSRRDPRFDDDLQRAIFGA